MSLNVQNKRFLAVLRELKVDLDLFPDKSFDCMFENNSNDINYVLDWFCENLSSDNVLTEEESDAYDEIEKSGQCIPDEELDRLILGCTPSYEAVTSLDYSYVNRELNEELKILNKQYERLLELQSDLELNHAKLKKAQNTQKEENSKWKKKQNNAKDECSTTNTSFNDILLDVKKFLSNGPSSAIDLHFLEQSVMTEDSLYQYFNNNHFNIYGNFNISNYDKRLPKFLKLEKDLSTAEFVRIATLGKLEGKKVRFDNLKKLLENKQNDEKFQSKMEEILSSWCVPYQKDVNKQLKNEILEIEHELQAETKKLSHLEICRFTAQCQLVDICINEGLNTKLEIFKSPREETLAFDLILLHILYVSFQNTNRVNQLMIKLFDKLRNDYYKERNNLDMLRRRNRRFKEIMDQLNEKHPFLNGLKKITPFDGEITKKNLLEIQRLSTSMMDLIRNPVYYPDQFYSQMEDVARLLSSKITTGPTKQLQFTTTEIQKKFGICELLRTQKIEEIKRLTSKYVSVKEAISQGNRQKLLLWTLFLADPDKLQSVMNTIQRESLFTENKYFEE